MSDLFIYSVLVPVVIVEDPVELVYYAGGSVNLSCSASGDPSPEIVWYKNEQPIILNDHVSIFDASVESTSDTGVVQSTLSFAFLMLTDDADYYCEASNLVADNTIFGARSHLVYLSVQCEHFANIYCFSAFPFCVSFTLYQSPTLHLVTLV